MSGTGHPPTVHSCNAGRLGSQNCGVKGITPGFSAIIHKQVPASTGFAQWSRTLLLMKARPWEKVQSLQAWMTRRQ